ncbi:MAG: copper homeostasis protein CutC [Phycisphaerales bacterium]
MPLEIAVDNLAEAVLASRHADRLELCAELDRHGMTPSDELVLDVVASVNIPVFALVRESDGYIADRATLGTLIESARRVVIAGATGIVIGVLTRRGEIDAAACRQIIDAARASRADVQVAFHRAFDDAVDTRAAIDTLAALGTTHTLCAGVPGLDHSARSLADRSATLVRARDLAASRIGIVACGGVRSSNAREFAAASGGWVHSSCRVHGRFDESQARELARLVR